MVEDLDELNIEVDASENAPADTPAVDIGDDISYVSVDAGDLTDDDYNSVEWEFSVSQDRLDEMDRDAEEVRLNRYNEATDEWESLETTHEGNNEFTSEAPGFSEFAISTASGPDMSVVDVELATTKVEADEPFDVMATVENEGETAGDITLELT